MIDLKEISRPLNKNEVLALKKMKSSTEQALRKKLKIHYFPIALILGSGFTYLAILIKTGFFVFIFGTLAVLLFSFVLFMPFELYKDFKKQKQKIKEIDSILIKNEIKVIPVEAIQIAIAQEYEDEGDLIIIEYQPDRILYLWDIDYNLRKRFPCLIFEIYEENFYKIIGRQLCPLSERIKPIVIDKKLKWEYLKKYGAPGQLTTEQISFKTLIDKYNNVA